MIVHETRVLRGPHITVFLEDWFTRKKKMRCATPSQPKQESVAAQIQRVAELDQERAA